MVVTAKASRQPTQKSQPSSRTQDTTPASPSPDIAPLLNGTMAAADAKPGEILQLQRTIGNRATQTLLRARPNTTQPIQRYADIPDRGTWETDSAIKRSRRSSDLEEVDESLDTWNGLKDSDDKHAQIEHLFIMQNKIRNWQNIKTRKYADKPGASSPRKAKLAELLLVIDQKLQQTQTAYRIDLAPLAAEFTDAAEDHDIDRTRTKATELIGKDVEFFQQTAQTAMTAAKTTDMLKWGTIFFGAPASAIGGGGFTSLGISMIADYSWLTTALSDKIIDDFLLPYSVGAGSVHIMRMLQHLPFRNELKAKATAAKYKAMKDKMPMLRISSDVETQVGAGTVDATNVGEMAQAVFNAFLDDLPISNLIYSTNSGLFQSIDYLLGNADAKIGAPCMILSSIFNELFKGTMQNPPPVIQMGDDRPLLTKKLAEIGDRGILTRETTFKGNVNRYGDVRGYDTINRIFFGDGHIWLKIGDREYDPTLGISGPEGTVAAQVEQFYERRSSSKFKAGKLTAKRTSAVPPGGPKLNFDRTVIIK